MKTTLKLLSCLLFTVIQLNAREIACPEVKSFRIAQCGNATLEMLMKHWEPCALASRLAPFALWMDSLAKPCSTMISDLKTRYAYFEDTVRYSIDYTGVSFEGAADAPVRIVAYISMSCPVCKLIYSDLSDSLKNGRMHKMALYVKPVPATPLEYALAAFQKEHKQDALLRELAPIRERVDMPMILEIADSLGVPRQKVEQLSQSKAIMDYVASSRAEAIKNGVTATPTFFINNKRYRSYKGPRWVIDAADFELDKIRSRGKVKK
jgi:hypothetical protein